MELTAKAILEADDTGKLERIELPEWGEGAHAYIRVMTGAERDGLEASSIGQGGTRNMQNFRARVASMVLADKDGKRLFQNPMDIPKLGNKSSIPLDRIFDAGFKLNRLSDDAVEAEAKNSESVQNGDSGSD